MRLAYTADLHGDIDAYHALLSLAARSGARAAIVGGDLLPHSIQLASAVPAQQAFVAERLRPLLARFRAQHPHIDVYLLAGNDDWAAAIAGLDDLEREGWARPLHERVYQLATADGRGPAASTLAAVDGRRPAVGGTVAIAEPGRTSELWLAGFACVPITPFSIKDYERRDDDSAPGERLSPGALGMAYTSWSGRVEPASAAEIARRPSIAESLAGLARRSDPGRTIYVCHTPPADTPLDLMPRGLHVGSRALRAFIETHAPPLTLHGHIHEAPALSGQYAARLGLTWSVNPGRAQRGFHAVTLDTDDIAGTIEHTVFGRPTETRRQETRRA